MRANGMLFFVAALLTATLLPAAPAVKKAIVLERPEMKTAGKLKVASPAFKPGQAIPGKYSQLGKNISPPLKWSGVPKEAKSLVLVLEDPDAPLSSPFVHWVVYAIPADAVQLPEAVPAKEQLEKPAGALQGRSSARKIGYFGPRPPKGDPPHHYHFQLFALDTAVDLRPGSPLGDVVQVMKGHVIAKGETVGTFQIP